MSTRLVLPVAPAAGRVALVCALTDLLRAVKVKTDPESVAGFGGHAFVVSVGPCTDTMMHEAFDWHMLVDGLQSLGRDVRLLSATARSAAAADLRREAVEAVCAELGAGRPCVARVDAGDGPEFVLVAGCEKDRLLVRRYRAGREPAVSDADVATDRLGPAGTQALFLVGGRQRRDAAADIRSALARALALLGGRHPGLLPGHQHGAEAFAGWGRQLGGTGAAGDEALAYAELQSHAAAFCGRLASSCPAAAGSLREAAAAFADSSDRLTGAAAGGAGPLLADCARLNVLARGALSVALGVV